MQIDANDNASPLPPASSRRVPLAAWWLAIPATIILAHVWLMPQGVWVDEFFTFAWFKTLGWHGVWLRLIHWAPRPASELLVYLYYAATQIAHRPLVAPCLIVAWGTWIAAMVGAVKPWHGPARLARIALVLGLTSLSLLAAPVLNLYYWPLAALAYLPSLGAASFAALTICTGGLDRPQARTGLCIALCIGACSVELGATLALSASPLLAIAEWRNPAPNRISRILLALLPGLIAALVMVMLMHGRVPGESNIGAGVTFHHGLLSLMAAAPVALGELTGSAYGLPGIAAATATKLLFFAAALVILCQGWPVRAARAPMLAVILGLAATFYASIAGAFYTLGSGCCERHQSYRQAILFLIILALAAMLRPARGLAFHRGLAPMLISASVMVTAPSRLSGILVESRLAPLRAIARQTLFNSGYGLGGTITYPIAPTGPLLRYDVIPTGDFHHGPKPQHYIIEGALTYFNKSRLVVTAMPEKPAQVR